MEITEVRVSLRDEERLKAFANVTFDNCFVVRSLKVIDGPNGLFISMPSRKMKDGSHRDMAHPINTEMRSKLEEVVLEAYRKELEQTGESNQSGEPKEE
ncbi:septation regulator SpoVG [candidate division TA06 bacterium]|nr:septation regulator SpoVG [candidate division TA06 bacterium]